MKFKAISSFVLASSFASLSNAATLAASPTDITFVSSSTTTTDAGTVVRGNSDQVEIRNRQLSQIATDNRTVATFANFDISSIPNGATINSATLNGVYASQLNNVNSSGPASVGAVATAWDTSGTNNPLLTYGWDHNTQSTVALNPQVFVADIQNTPATNQAVSGDFTSTVQGWLNGSLDNNGLVFFMDGAGSQGAGFNSISLDIDYTAIPEPSSSLLLVLSGLGALTFRSRRR